MLESVVLVNERGEAIGQQPKSSVHHAETPLHLAFSLYLFDHGGKLLMTRRALSKVTWPGVWTNSCCGHPLPGESMIDAIRRRVLSELGVEVEDLRSVLPNFAYQARDASGIWENEICPVFRATLAPAAQLQPDPTEVMDYSWADADQVAVATAATPFAFSPWAVEQIFQMTDRLDPVTAGTTQRSELTR